MGTVTELKISNPTDNNFKSEFSVLYTLLWDKMLNTVCRKYTKDIDKAQYYGLQLLKRGGKLSNHTLRNIGL